MDISPVNSSAQEDPVSGAVVGIGVLARAATLLALAALVFLPLTARAADQRFITIGTAGVTGVYYPAGGATCQLLNEGRAEHGVRCSVETTLGSIENVRKLRAGDLEFAYVQSDWQHHAYHGTSVFAEDGPYGDLRSIFALHSEVATLVVRDDSRFREFDDLKSARVNTGSEGSGSNASWRILTEQLGWDAKDSVNTTSLPSSELSEALCSGRIEAYFMLIGHPADLVDETREKCGIRLLGIENEALDAFLAKSPFYSQAEIPAGLYGLENPIPSYGVTATLVTSADMPDEVVYTLVQAVFENFDGFKGLHPALGRLEAANMAAYRMAAPLHPGALKFFAEKGLVPEQ